MSNRAALPRLHSWLLRLGLVLGAFTATGASLPAAGVAPRASGTPLLRLWTAEDYGAAPGNRCVLQHPETGYIYAGNNTGVLEFDGTRWRLLRVPGRPTVRSLAVDHSGQIWTANDDTICRLTPDARGELQAVSVRERLPAAVREFRSAFTTLATPEGVVVAAGPHLFRFGPGDGPAQVWALPAGAPVVRLWLTEGAVHWQTAQRRVFRLQGEAIVAVPEPAAWLSGPGFRPAPAVAAVLATLNAQGEEGALDAVSLADGRIAVATARDGLWVYGRNGDVVQRLNRASGLPSQRIEGLAEDREGGVWLALRNGLVRVQLDSPYALHGAAQGFDGSLVNLGLEQTQLYLAAGEGLMRRADDGRFRFVEHLTGAPRRMVSAGGRTYVAGSNLQLAQPGGRYRVLDERPHLGFAPVSTAPGVFAFGTPGGLWLGRMEGEAWRRLGRCAPPTGAMHLLLVHPAGVLWAVSSQSGLWRVDLRGGVRLDPPARNFKPADGVPAGLNEINTRAFLLGEELELIGRGRLLRFDEAGERFRPETRIAGLPRPAPAAGRPDAIEPQEEVLVALGCSGPGGTAWVQLPPPTRQTLEVRPEGVGRWRAVPQPGPSLGRFAPLELLHDPAARTLWLGGAAGLISQDLDWTVSRPPPPLVARVRRVESGGGELLWAEGGGAAGERPGLDLPSTRGAVRFTLAAPTYPADYRGRSHTLFRTRLEGLDEGWTAWSRSAVRDFTNLPYREFVLRVQARDDDGRTSAETTFSFRRLAPWWLTGWAFAAYAAAGLLAGREVVRFRTRALRRKAAELEAIIAARTEELRVQNLELARLHRLELDEKTVANLAAQRARLAQERSDLELLRYQLNPHFLFNALTSVSGLVVTKPAVARGMVAKLAEFCRGTLTRRSEETRTLAEEFAMLTNYLEIEKVRWEEGLLVEVSLADEVRDFRLPAFLLLPLVENAVKYGGQTSPEVLQIRLRGQAEAGGVCIEVANTGRWLEAASTPDSTHIGLENLRERLAHVFPQRHELTTEAGDGWVIARLKLRPAA